MLLSRFRNDALFRGCPQNKSIRKRDFGSATIVVTEEDDTLVLNRSDASVVLYPDE
jgi:hypothetical protein